MATCLRGLGTVALGAIFIFSAFGSSEGGKGSGNQQSCIDNPLYINKLFVKSAPYELVEAIGGIPMKRHHIIPKSRLIFFFNKVVERDCQQAGELKKVGPVLKKLAKYANDHRLRFPNILFHADTIDRLKKEKQITADEADNVYRIAIKVADKISSGVISASNLPVKESVDAKGLALLKILHVWNPFNIIIGPGERIDDPNEGFEDHAGEIIGNHDFDILKQINDQMITYITSGSNLDSIVSLLSNVVKETKINNDHAYGYNPSKWVQENGKFRILESKSKATKGNRGTA